MTVEQYQRWKEFSLSMAARGFEEITEARSAKLVEYVGRFFEMLEFDEEWRGMRGWDEKEPGSGCLYATDLFSEWLAQVPGYWRLSEAQYENWKFADQLHCCIRAGIDVASEPSAGVLGFRVGDVQRMFNGKVPDWVSAAYKQDLNQADPCAGVWL